MLRMELIIKGTVQGVGFRQSVMSFVQDQQLNIAGHVRNLPSGEVEIKAEGDLASLRQLLGFCHQGPPSAHVREMKEDFTDAKGDLEEAFTILSGS